MIYLAPMDEIEWMKPKSVGGRYRLIARGGNGLARVRAEWIVAPNSPAVGPWRVTVSRSRQGLASKDNEGGRGVTSPVLADAQPVIVAMTRALPEQTRALEGLDPMDEIRDRAARLPDGPRQSSSYYRLLANVYGAIQHLGVHNPLQVLAEITGRPESTLKLHLRKAREEQG
ncbi:hypothetical protein GCM10027425_24750 [Alteromonas gracilis]